jgi:hypothetical protein
MPDFVTIVLMKIHFFGDLNPCRLAEVYRRIEDTVLFGNVAKDLLFNTTQRAPKLE